ncbi:outer membrane protein [Bradyrhizobium sp. G127]|uniref:outer membrane protein n=1 Tax=Bradyrhizobium sp. G127 TaxID=2904800 RepID=UPI001F1E65FF|nr:outer membrane protein [Bradyrhizobium sp. G127]MCF2522218.1 porin family protein [Bradyrhizobium sp. G127]
MSKIIIGAIAAAATCVTATAQAADMYGRRPYSQPYTVHQPLANSWMGPYIGGNLGYGWGDVSNNGARPSGVLGGLQAGYNYQSGQLVLGIEGDLQLNSADDTFAGWKFSNPWFGTVRGRLGYAFNNVLLYGTGGLAFGTLKTEMGGFSESHTSAGWTAGVGAEYAINQNWSAKIEYLYVDLSEKTFLMTGLPNGYQFSTIRVGVNYRF